MNRKYPFSTDARTLMLQKMYVDFYTARYNNEPSVFADDFNSTDWLLDAINKIPSDLKVLI